MILANAAGALDVRHPGYRDGMTVLRSVLLFGLAALAEIGGAWLVWQGVREHRGLAFVGAGILALGLYGFVATFQSDPHFGRILAAYGGVFVAGSLAWGMAVDGFRPDRYDLVGAALCLAGVAVIMYAPGPASTGRPTPNWEQAWRLRPTRRSCVGWLMRCQQRPPGGDRRAVCASAGRGGHALDHTVPEQLP